jgi:hypothetical protein
MKVEVYNETYNGHGAYRVYAYPETGYEFIGEVKMVHTAEATKKHFHMTHIKWNDATWPEFIQDHGTEVEDMVYRAFPDILNLTPLAHLELEE